MPVITAREAAKDFIRPFIIGKITNMLLHKSNRNAMAERYSAFLKDKKTIVVDMVDNKEIKKEFSLKKIISDIAEEHFKAVKRILSPED